MRSNSTFQPDVRRKAFSATIGHYSLLDRIGLYQVRTVEWRIPRICISSCISNSCKRHLTTIHTLGKVGSQGLQQMREGSILHLCHTCVSWHLSCSRRSSPRRFKYDSNLYLSCVLSSRQFVSGLITYLGRETKVSYRRPCIGLKQRFAPGAVNKH